ncbi:GGDEF domain-containing protein [Caenimonas terrae]|uniref:GGDEF domain-containing protein n=1 Tax=Caenimonas terrae TaxID=696074 RepID=A0ABW0NLH1_9BURK
MNTVAVGFWGAFFGSAALMLAASLLAYLQTRHKVPLRAAQLAVVSALFTLAYLGGLPMPDGDAEKRVLAHIAAVSFALPILQLLAWLGLTRGPERRRLASMAVWGLAALVVLVGWMLSARQALMLSSLVIVLMGLVALPLAARSALLGDRLAWLAFAGMFFVDITLAGLSWIALEEVTAWPVHAVSAIAGTAFLATFSVAVWERYSYLLELRQVMAYGPAYDPVTRMRSHAETGQMVGAAFVAAGGEARPVGVIAVSIGNLYALEQLHGRGAANHALFVCASRLRRIVPGNVEMGRLGEDGFLLVTRDTDGPQRLVALARQVAQRLARPVSLSTSDPTAETSGRAGWVADVGVGVLAASAPATRPANAVTMARDMSRTAWSYGSRIAWFDRDRREIAELPLTDGRR